MGEVRLPISGGNSGSVPGPETPLSLDHFRRIEEAKRRSRKVRNAARFAAFNAWTLAVFAVVSACAGLFGDFTSLTVGVILGVFAFNEFRGEALLKKFNQRGPKLLGWNQIVLGFALVGYAVWSLIASRNTTLESTGDAEIDATVRGLTSMVTLGLYGTLAVIGVIVPGLTAWYYFSRAKIIDSMLDATEPWVIETLRAAM